MRIAWFHFQFDIPDDWEPSSYSVEPRIGRIEFSNRHGYQALISWERCLRQPDLAVAMVSFLRQKMPACQTHDLRSKDAISTLAAGNFIIGWHGDLPAQAVGYLPDEKILLRWIFQDGSEAAARDFWAPLATSFQPNVGPLQRYALFGLDFQLPREFVLEEMNCLPANVRMTFESNTKMRATFRRWGLTEVVLQGQTLANFYINFLQAEGCRELAIAETEIAGCPAVCTPYTQRGQHQMDRFMGRWWTEGRAVLWHDQTEGRIYSFEQIGPSKVPRLEFETVFPGRMGE